MTTTNQLIADAEQVLAEIEAARSSGEKALALTAAEVKLMETMRRDYCAKRLPRAKETAFLRLLNRSIEAQLTALKGAA